MRSSAINWAAFALKLDAAGFQNINVIGEPQDAADVLLGDEHRSALRIDACGSTSMIVPNAFGESPSEGSSSRRQRGDDISARASASICCSPPDRSAAIWPARSRRIGK